LATRPNLEESEDRPTLNTDPIKGLDPHSPEAVIRRLYGKLPTTISEAIAIGTGITVSHKPWSTTQGEDGLIVYLPPNLESKGDDPLTLAAVAACKVLQPHFIVSSELAPETPVLDKKSKQYLTGVAWALQSGVNGLVPYQEVSGPTGYGYYWVAHRSLEHTVGSVWWAKGKSKHPTEGLTGKAWSSDLDETTRRVESLLGLAAKHIDSTQNALTYFRSRESFLGSEISKKLPYEDSSIMTEPEKRELFRRFNQPISQYNQLVDSLPCQNLNEIRTLAERIKKTQSDLKPLRDRCEMIISHRMASLYSKDMGKRKKTGDTVLNRIDRLELGKRIHIFDPLIVIPNYRTFRVDDELDLENSEVKVELFRQYTNVIAANIRSNQIPKEFGEECAAWASSLLGVDTWELQA
jgi:hypothetical protein